jgi:hypothetical protein
MRVKRRERQDRDKVSDAKSRKQRPSIDGAAGPCSRRVVREGKAMIHTSRRDRKAKAIAENSSRCRLTRSVTKIQ